ncbi:unnamed protein product [Meganyctiphanes norvegica]|uniref:WAP domain-containing protein n=1 Tax=Meganyctiphanes norvegica TaxID=48144 RepID=A0AAV2PQ43_MEGNR
MLQRPELCQSSEGVHISRSHLTLCTKMHLSTVCLCLVASYVVAEEPVEHRGSDGTRIFSLGLSHNNFPGGGYPNSNNNNYPGSYPSNNNNHFPGGAGGYPGNGGQSGSCKYWCKTPQNQYYCCEQPGQQIGGGNPGGNVGTKPGFCPPVRPKCPPTRFGGPPRQCSNDYSCGGRDKCCFDTCLQHHTCKPVQGGGIYG